MRPCRGAITVITRARTNFEIKIGKDGSSARAQLKFPRPLFDYYRRAMAMINLRRVLFVCVLESWYFTVSRFRFRNLSARVGREMTLKDRRELNDVLVKSV